MWRTLIVSLALICLVLLGWYAVRKFPGRIESDLRSRAQTALAARAPNVIVQASQRDIVLSGRVADDNERASIERLVSDLSGVRSVVSQLGTGDAAAPTPPVEPDVVGSGADATADAGADASTPEAEVTADAAADAGPTDAGDLVADAATEVAGDASGEVATLELDALEPEEVAADTSATDTAPAPVDTAAPAAGKLTPAQCKDLIAKTVEGEKRIAFRSNTGKLTEEGEARLAEVFAILQRCPDATGVIEAYHDDYGDPDKLKTLTQIRAYNTHKRLVDLGMDEKRFRYIGLGYRNMRYRGPGERVLNQRVEFNITVE